MPPKKSKPPFPRFDDVKLVSNPEHKDHDPTLPETTQGAIYDAIPEKEKPSKSRFATYAKVAFDTILGTINAESENTAQQAVYAALREQYPDHGGAFGLQKWSHDPPGTYRIDLGDGKNQQKAVLDAELVAELPRVPVFWLNKKEHEAVDTEIRKQNTENLGSQIMSGAIAVLRDNYQYFRDQDMKNEMAGKYIYSRSAKLFPRFDNVKLISNPEHENHDPNLPDTTQGVIHDEIKDEKKKRRYEIYAIVANEKFGIPTAYLDKLQREDVRTTVNEKFPGNSGKDIIDAEKAVQRANHQYIWNLDVRDEILHKTVSFPRFDDVKLVSNPEHEDHDPNLPETTQGAIYDAKSDRTVRSRFAIYTRVAYDTILGTINAESENTAQNAVYGALREKYPNHGGAFGLEKWSHDPPGTYRVNLGDGKDQPTAELDAELVAKLPRVPVFWFNKKERKALATEIKKQFPGNYAEQIISTGNVMLQEKYQYIRDLGVKLELAGKLQKKQKLNQRSAEGDALPPSGPDGEVRGSSGAVSTLQSDSNVPQLPTGRDEPQPSSDPPLLSQYLSPNAPRLPADKVRAALDSLEPGVRINADVVGQLFAGMNVYNEEHRVPEAIYFVTPHQMQAVFTPGHAESDAISSSVLQRGERYFGLPISHRDGQKSFGLYERETGNFEHFRITKKADLFGLYDEYDPEETRARHVREGKDVWLKLAEKDHAYHPHNEAGRHTSENVSEQVNDADCELHLLARAAAFHYRSHGILIESASVPPLERRTVQACLSVFHDPPENIQAQDSNAAAQAPGTLISHQTHSAQQQDIAWDELERDGWRRSLDGKFFSNGRDVLSVAQVVTETLESMPENIRDGIWTAQSDYKYFLFNDDNPIDADGKAPSEVVLFDQAFITTDHLKKTLKCLENKRVIDAYKESLFPRYTKEVAERYESIAGLYLRELNHADDSIWLHSRESLYEKFGQEKQLRGDVAGSLILFRGSSNLEPQPDQEMGNDGTVSLAPTLPTYYNLKIFSNPAHPDYDSNLPETTQGAIIDAIEDSAKRSRFKNYAIVAFDTILGAVNAGSENPAQNQIYNALHEQYPEHKGAFELQRRSADPPGTYRVDLGDGTDRWAVLDPDWVSELPRLPVFWLSKKQRNVVDGAVREEFPETSAQPIISAGTVVTRDNIKYVWDLDVKNEIASRRRSSRKAKGSSDNEQSYDRSFAQGEDDVALSLPAALSYSGPPAIGTASGQHIQGGQIIGGTQLAGGASFDGGIVTDPTRDLPGDFRAPESGSVAQIHPSQQQSSVWDLQPVNGWYRCIDGRRFSTGLMEVSLPEHVLPNMFPNIPKEMRQYITAEQWDGSHFPLYYSKTIQAERVAIDNAGNPLAGYDVEHGGVTINHLENTIICLENKRVIDGYIESISQVRSDTFKTIHQNASQRYLDNLNDANDFIWIFTTGEALFEAHGNEIPVREKVASDIITFRDNPESRPDPGITLSASASTIPQNQRMLHDPSVSIAPTGINAEVELNNRRYRRHVSPGGTIMWHLVADNTPAAHPPATASPAGAQPAWPSFSGPPVYGLAPGGSEGREGMEQDVSVASQRSDNEAVIHREWYDAANKIYKSAYNTLDDPEYKTRPLEHIPSKRLTDRCTNVEYLLAFQSLYVLAHSKNTDDETFVSDKKLYSVKKAVKERTLELIKYPYSLCFPADFAAHEEMPTFHPQRKIHREWYAAAGKAYQVAYDQLARSKYETTPLERIPTGDLVNLAESANDLFALQSLYVFANGKNTDDEIFVSTNKLAYVRRDVKDRQRDFKNKIVEPRRKASSKSDIGDSVRKRLSVHPGWDAPASEQLHGPRSAPPGPAQATAGLAGTPSVIPGEERIHPALRTQPAAPSSYFGDAALGLVAPGGTESSAWVGGRIGTEPALNPPPGDMGAPQPHASPGGTITWHVGGGNAPPGPAQPTGGSEGTHSFIPDDENRTLRMQPTAPSPYSGYAAVGFAPGGFEIREGTEQGQYLRGDMRAPESRPTAAPIAQMHSLPQQASVWDQQPVKGWYRSSDGRKFSNGSVEYSLQEDVLPNSFPKIDEKMRQKITADQWDGTHYPLFCSPSVQAGRVAIDYEGNLATDYIIDFNHAGITIDNIENVQNAVIYLENKRVIDGFIKSLPEELNKQYKKGLENKADRLLRSLNDANDFIWRFTTGEDLYEAHGSQLREREPVAKRIIAFRNNPQPRPDRMTTVSASDSSIPQDQRMVHEPSVSIAPTGLNAVVVENRWYHRHASPGGTIKWHVVEDNVSPAHPQATASPEVAQPAASSISGSVFGLGPGSTGSGALFGGGIMTEPAQYPGDTDVPQPQGPLQGIWGVADQFQQYRNAQSLPSVSSSFDTTTHSQSFNSSPSQKRAFPFSSDDNSGPHQRARTGEAVPAIGGMAISNPIFDPIRNLIESAQEYHLSRGSERELFAHQLFRTALLTRIEFEDHETIAAAEDALLQSNPPTHKLFLEEKDQLNSEKEALRSRRQQSDAPPRAHSGNAPPLEQGEPPERMVAALAGEPGRSTGGDFSQDAPYELETPPDSRIEPSPNRRGRAPSSTDIDTGTEVRRPAVSRSSQAPSRLAPTRRSERRELEAAIRASLEESSRGTSETRRAPSLQGVQKPSGGKGRGGKGKGRGG